jgi:tetratricopeptide (TPR) repeat protein
LRKWVQSSEWNFSNKLYLLEAEHYFWRGDHERAIAFYNASIKAAHEHRFIHEEGLAEEKTATYLLRIGKHDEAMGHFLNAKKCYEVWGANKLVQRVDKAIAILLPMCGKGNAY